MSNEKLSTVATSLEFKVVFIGVDVTRGHLTKNKDSKIKKKVIILMEFISCTINYKHIKIIDSANHYETWITYEE